MTPPAGSGTPSGGPGGPDATGVRRLATGAGLGLAGGLAAVILPIAFLWLSARNPGGFFTFGHDLIEATSVLVLAGSILFVLSLILYRRAFANLRKVDPRFTVSSALCLIGTVGFLLLIVTAVLLFAGSDALLNCLHGEPSQTLRCLRSAEPAGAVTGLLGFLLGWVGGVGIVLGVATAGRRFHQRSLVGGAVLYALLLLVLAGPFAFALVAFAGVEYLLLAVPILTVLAPAFVLEGARRVAPLDR